MPIKAYKPTSNGRRNMTALTKEEITTSTPEKSLLAPYKKKGGRNNMGQSLLDIMVVDIRENTELLILSVIRMEYLVRLLLSNMIQTDLQTSL